jgi:hypothetical protein
MTAKEFLNQEQYYAVTSGDIDEIINAMVNFANYHLEKYKEYLLQEGDKYTTDYPINQKITTLIININKFNSYNIK